MNEAKLLKAIISGFIIGATQLGTGAFLTLRGKKNIGLSSKAYSKIIQEGESFIELFRRIFGKAA